MKTPKEIPEFIFGLIDVDPLTGVITRVATDPREKSNGKSQIGDVLGYRTDTGYLEFCILGHRLLNHRVVFQKIYGYAPPRVDHCNGVGTDNRPCNLRAATQSQNVHNSARPRRGFHSKFKGVTFDKSRGKWVAQIKGAHGRSVCIGRFDSELKAAVAYDQTALRLRGEFAWLNFPGDREQPKRRAEHDADEARRAAL